MSRPHEDRERHTAVDHRPSGDAIAFSRDQWCAIDVLHVPEARVDAAVSAYETLIEEAQRSAASAGPAVIFRSADRTRVVVIVQLGGHAAFRHLRSAWDAHRLYNEHRAKAHASELGLYRVFEALEDTRIDPASTDHYSFERCGKTGLRVEAVFEALGNEIGFRGALAFTRDDDRDIVLMMHFEHEREYGAFRSSAAAVAAFGAAQLVDEPTTHVHAVKTFGSVN
jgi:hypothetical protein